MRKTVNANQLTLTDRLSRLTREQAVALLGFNAEELLRKARGIDIDVEHQVQRSADQWTLTLPDATVTLRLSNRARFCLDLICGLCAFRCVHEAALLSLILHEKLVLGLAREPTDRPVLGLLSETQAEQMALSEREHRATEESFQIRSLSPDSVWADYVVTNRTSGRTWRVALRDLRRGGDSFCACPDFRSNSLQTCKHLLVVQRYVEAHFSEAERRRPWERFHFSIHLRHDGGTRVVLSLPSALPEELASKCRPFVEGHIQDPTQVLEQVERLRQMEYVVIVYPDAAQWLAFQRMRSELQGITDEMRADPREHPLGTNLLKVPLLPYQVEGVAFAAATGRSILADDMGLGKTIQAIGVAELMARYCGIARVLVICPASIKTQWCQEIAAFSERSVALVSGKAMQRAHQYRCGAFFIVCNYEQIRRDFPMVEDIVWDLVILDEGQRIKNIESKTARVMKELKRQFSLVLTGTPLENRLEDLFSILEFVDPGCLGPAFRFLNRHRIVTPDGKVLGYRELDDVRHRLSSVLLRRTRDEVLHDLPVRNVTVVRVPITSEQKSIHDGYMGALFLLLEKKVLSEMDLLYMQMYLQLCRRTADSACLLFNIPSPANSGKIAYLRGFLPELGRNPDRKMVIFSEWTTMLDRIEPLLSDAEMRFVRLDGKVPQKERQVRVNLFQRDPGCRAFLTTNAGSTGLNLQAADTIINVDLPWNPAVLEQRIARAHRMGQKRPVQAWLLVSDETIEEKMLRTLEHKERLAKAVLDPDSLENRVKLESGLEAMKRRLEWLIGDIPEGHVRGLQQHQMTHTATMLARRQAMAKRNGKQIVDSFSAVPDVVATRTDTRISDALIRQFKESLTSSLETAESGEYRLHLTFQHPDAVDRLAESLAILSVLNGDTDRRSA